MPRKRKAARPYRRLRTGIRKEIRERFAPGTWDGDLLLVEDFFRELDTETARNAFADEFPAKFYRLFGFFATDFDKYPASVIHMGGSCVFRRPDFMEFLATYPPRAPFNPPDLRSVPYRERQVTMARARGAWWKANGWPLNDAEARWILFGGPKEPRAQTPRKLLTMPAAEGAE